MKYKAGRRRFLKKAAQAVATSAVLPHVIPEIVAATNPKSIPNPDWVDAKNEMTFASAILPEAYRHSPTIRFVCRGSTLHEVLNNPIPE